MDYVRQKSIKFHLVASVLGIFLASYCDGFVTGEMNFKSGWFEKNSIFFLGVFRRIIKIYLEFF